MTGSAPLSLFPEPARDVLAFWFAQPREAPETSLQERSQRQASRKEWFVKSDEFDAACRDQLGALCEAALAGELDDWVGSADAELARIILLDQVTRNIFRGTPKMFAGDAQALEASKRLVTRGALEHLTPHETAFALLPMEHAEDLTLQQDSVRLFEALAAAHPAPEIESYADYARRHRDVIVRFGRFPHRNALLGRPSTPQEAEFLKQPGSSF